MDENAEDTEWVCSFCERGQCRRCWDRRCECCFGDGED